MSIVQQSSKAQDRTLGDIQQGQVKLPRFQRFEAWDRNRMRKRLKTHLIDYDDLAKANYGAVSGHEFVELLNADFTVFMRNRALLVEAAMKQLADGESPDALDLWSVLNAVEEAVV